MDTNHSNEVIMQFSQEVLDHFYQPRNIGDAEKLTGYIVDGQAHTPGGDIVRLYLQIDSDQIVDAKFKAQGSGFTIAACSWTTEWLKQKNIDEARTLSCQLIAQSLYLPETKFYAAVLVEDSLKQALSLLAK